MVEGAESADALQMVATQLAEQIERERHRREEDLESLQSELAQIRVRAVEADQQMLDLRQYVDRRFQELENRLILGLRGPTPRVPVTIHPKVAEALGFGGRSATANEPAESSPETSALSLFRPAALREVLRRRLRNAFQHAEARGCVAGTGLAGPAASSAALSIATADRFEELEVASDDLRAEFYERLEEGVRNGAEDGSAPASLAVVLQAGVVEQLDLIESTGDALRTKLAATAQTLQSKMHAAVGFPVDDASPQPTVERPPSPAAAAPELPVEPAASVVISSFRAPRDAVSPSRALRSPPMDISTASASCGVRGHWQLLTPHGTVESFSEAVAQQPIRPGVEAAAVAGPQPCLEPVAARAVSPSASPVTYTEVAQPQYVIRAPLSPAGSLVVPCGGGSTRSQHLFAASPASGSRGGSANSPPPLSGSASYPSYASGAITPCLSTGVLTPLAVPVAISGPAVLHTNVASGSEASYQLPCAGASPSSVRRTSPARWASPTRQEFFGDEGGLSECFLRPLPSCPITVVAQPPYAGSPALSSTAPCPENERRPENGIDSATLPLMPRRPAAIMCATEPVAAAPAPQSPLRAAGREAQVSSIAAPPPAVQSSPAGRRAGSAASSLERSAAPSAPRTPQLGTLTRSQVDGAPVQLTKIVTKALTKADSPSEASLEGLATLGASPKIDKANRRTAAPTAAPAPSWSQGRASLRRKANAASAPQG